MNFQRGREKEPLEINLVPLIDVMMVILIFLMITTTYNRYAELAINLMDRLLKGRRKRACIPGRLNHDGWIVGILKEASVNHGFRRLIHELVF